MAASEPTRTHAREALARSRRAWRARVGLRLEAAQEQVAALLARGGIWQPWRAALTLAVSGQGRWYDEVLAVLDATSFAYGGSQAVLAVGLTGEPRAASVLEEYLRSHYGRQGYDAGKAALITLGKSSAPGRAAVTEAAFRLIRHHPKGLRTDGGLQFEEGHSERVRYIQTTAIEILRTVGTAEAAEVLAGEQARIVQPSQQLLDYFHESVRLMRERGAP